MTERTTPGAPCAHETAPSGLSCGTMHATKGSVYHLAILEPHGFRPGRDFEDETTAVEAAVREIQIAQADGREVTVDLQEHRPDGSLRTVWSGGNPGVSCVWCGAEDDIRTMRIFAGAMTPDGLTGTVCGDCQGELTAHRRGGHDEADLVGKSNECPLCEAAYLSSMAAHLPGRMVPDAQFAAESRR